MNASGSRRVVPGDQGLSMAWFVLSPAMEYYYGPIHPEYRPLPAFDGHSDDVPLGMIYPEQGAQLFVPIQLDGTCAQVVLHAAHRDPRAKVHWDLDGAYVGTTELDHKLAVDLEKGPHQLTLTDQQGAALQTHFQVEKATARRDP